MEKSAALFLTETAVRTLFFFKTGMGLTRLN